MANACKAINLAALSRIHISRDPWPWGTYEGPFHPEVLEARFPTDHFSYHSQYRILEAMGRQKSDSWYQHNVRTRPLLELGKKQPFEPDSLDPIWLDVAHDLISPAFREVLSDAVQYDVRKLDMQAHFWEFAEGSFFQPHVDKPHKIVTFLMYLTKNWTEEHGGCLNILGSADPCDVRRVIAPRANTAVVLKREAQAWHSVSRIPIGVARNRLLLQAWFWHSP
jgi:hypothetical protein